MTNTDTFLATAPLSIFFPPDHIIPDEESLMDHLSNPYMDKVALYTADQAVPADVFKNATDFLARHIVAAQKAGEPLKLPKNLLQTVTVDLNGRDPEEVVRKFLELLLSDDDKISLGEKNLQPHIAKLTKDGKVEITFLNIDLEKLKNENILKPFDPATIDKAEQQVSLTRGVRRVPQESSYEGKVQAALAYRAAERHAGVSFGDEALGKMISRYEGQIKLANAKNNDLTFETIKLPAKEAATVSFSAKEETGNALLATKVEVVPPQPLPVPVAAAVVGIIDAAKANLSANVEQSARLAQQLRDQLEAEEARVKREAEAAKAEQERAAAAQKALLEQHGIKTVDTVDRLVKTMAPVLPKIFAAPSLLPQLVLKPPVTTGH